MRTKLHDKAVDDLTFWSFELKFVPPSNALIWPSRLQASSSFSSNQVDAAAAKPVLTWSEVSRWRSREDLGIIGPVIVKPHNFDLMREYGKVTCQMNEQVVMLISGNLWNVSTSDKTMAVSKMTCLSSNAGHEQAILNSKFPQHQTCAVAKKQDPGFTGSDGKTTW